MPANGADTVVVIAALGVAKKTILIFVRGAGGDRFADSTAVGLEPACRVFLIFITSKLLLGESKTSNKCQNLISSHFSNKKLINI